MRLDALLKDKIDGGEQKAVVRMKLEAQEAEALPTAVVTSIQQRVMDCQLVSRLEAPTGVPLLVQLIDQFLERIIRALFSKSDAGSYDRSTDPSPSIAASCRKTIWYSP